MNVNEGFAATFGSIDAPMGGMKISGLGRRQGRDGSACGSSRCSRWAPSRIPLAPSFGLSPRTFVRGVSAMRLFRRLRRAG